MEGPRGDRSRPLSAATARVVLPFLVLALVCWSLWGTLETHAGEEVAVARAVEKTRPGPQLQSPVYVVVDAGTGTSLLEKNADEPHSIASLTKLMSAMVYLDLNTGYITDAGYCLALTGQKGDGPKLHMVFMGAPYRLSRFGDAGRVAAWAAGGAEDER